jgi:glutaredoxin
MGRAYPIGADRCPGILRAMSIVMYVKPGCPYCEAARTHFFEQGEVFEERDATQNAGWKAELMGYTHDTGVVPTIVRSSGEPRLQVGFPPGSG